MCFRAFAHVILWGLFISLFWVNFKNWKLLKQKCIIHWDMVHSFWTVFIPCNVVWLWLLLFSGKLPPAEIPKEWISMVDPCVKKMREQINTELTASMTYLAMVGTICSIYYNGTETIIDWVGVVIVFLLFVSRLLISHVIQWTVLALLSISLSLLVKNENMPLNWLSTCWCVVSSPKTLVTSSRIR